MIVPVISPSVISIFLLSPLVLCTSLSYPVVVDVVSDGRNHHVPAGAVTATVVVLIEDANRCDNLALSLSSHALSPTNRR